MVDVPEETCDLNPQKTCRLATKLVPRLKPKHQCTVFPTNVCQLKFTTPRVEKKPLRSEWCLDESPVVPGETYNEANARGRSLDSRSSRSRQDFNNRSVEDVTKIFRELQNIEA